MKDTSRVMALSLYLPNCDRKGFFKRKQVTAVECILLRVNACIFKIIHNICKKFKRNFSSFTVLP